MARVSSLRTCDQPERHRPGVTDTSDPAPLITRDKPDIISEARRIGTLEFAGDHAGALAA